MNISRKTRLFRQFALVSCALVVALLNEGCRPAPTHATVSRRDVVGYAVLNGSLEIPPTARADVSARVTAPVERVLVTEGQKVAKGDELIDLAFPSAEAALEQARLELKAEETTFANAQTRLAGPVEEAQRRLNEAKARQAAAQGDDPMMEQVLAEVVAAEAALAWTKEYVERSLAPHKQELDYARQNFDLAKAGARASAIRAPIAGTIVELNVQSGGRVEPNDRTPLVTIIDTDSLQVHAELTPEQFGEFKAGTPVILEFDGIQDRQFRGEIVKVLTKPSRALFARASDVEYLAIIEFKNENDLVNPASKLTAVLVKTGEAKNVLAVPTDAVDTDASGRPVVKVLVDGEWTPKLVEAGLSGGGYTEIKSGLNEGDSIQVTPGSS